MLDKTGCIHVFLLQSVSLLHWKLLAESKAMELDISAKYHEQLWGDGPRT